VVDDAGGRLDLAALTPLPVHGNRTLISQALSNLIDNAIKYAVDGSRPLEIRLSGAVSGDTVRLTVSDNGPGIAKADRSRALQRFVRLDGSRSKQGSGLGLSLVLAVAHMHGGDVEMSDAEPGLQVTLRLPRRTEALPAPVA